MRYKESRTKDNTGDNPAAHSISVFDTLGTQSAVLAHDAARIAHYTRSRAWALAALRALAAAECIHAAIEASAWEGQAV